MNKGTNAPILTVKDLKVHFNAGGGGLFRKPSVVHAVDGVSFEVPRQSTFGIVGESGSGKSTTALAIMRLVSITEGSIELGGADLSKASNEALRTLRRRVQIIFQDPFSSLNPRTRAGSRSPRDRRSCSG